MRALPSLLCVVVVLSSVGGVAATPAAVSSPSASTAQSAGPIEDVDARVRTAPNASNVSADLNVLAIPAPQVRRSGVERAVVDVPRSVAIGANVSGVRIATIALRDRVRAAPNETIRQRRLVIAMNEFAADVESLRTRQRRAINAYSDGRITPREFLFRLARVSAEAEALQARLQVLRTLASETEDFSLNGTRRATLRFELRSFSGPVVERVARVMRGEAPSTRVFVETGPRSVTVTTIANGTYVRESYRGPLRGDGGTISALRAEEIVAESYPTIWSNRSVDRTSITGSGSIYVARVHHEFGRLTVFVDGGSENVFQEFHRRPLETINRTDTASATRDGLRLVVNRTYAGGALRIRLLGADSGEPVDATITVAAGGETSDVVGRTGDDGVLWTLAHRGEFTITAIKDTRVVILTVSSQRPDDANGGRPT